MIAENDLLNLVTAAEYVLSITKGSPRWKDLHNETLQSVGVANMALGLSAVNGVVKS